MFVSEDQSVALFLFVQGTDPECTLLLSIEDDQTWRYALARMNRDALQIKDGDRVVQQWDHLRDTWTDRTTSYVTFNFDPSRLNVESTPSGRPATEQPNEEP